MQPGGTLKKFFRRVTPAGAAVTGKVTGDFTFTGYYCAPGGAMTATTLSGTITEGTNGWYMASALAPPVRAQWMLDVDVASGTDCILAPLVQGETENNELDSIAASVARPIVTITGQGTIGQITPIAIVHKRARTIRFAFKDANGANIDMTSGTTYNNYKFGVRGYPDQTLTPPKLDATNGLATPSFTWGIVGANGYIDVTIPEDATIFGALAEGANAADTYECRYELTGDLVATPNATIPLVQSSQLLITRREVGT